MKFEANKDNFHDNIWYFTYNPLDGVDKAKIDFGDGDVVPVWPPRGQVTHQYDRPGRYTVKITDGKRTLGTVAVDAR